MPDSRIARPDGAPRGLVRAHLATFPARAGIFRRVVDAILPQVDRLVIVFNEMDEAPADLEADPRIEAITTDRDTKDLGRFFTRPRPDDIVFLIDDDIAYPADYVARSIERADAIGWDGNVFGYAASDFRHGAEGERGWRRIRPDAALPQPLGVRMLGTGTALARGDAIPTISEMAPYLGHADVGFALLNHRAGRRAWSLPRKGKWLADALPEDLASSRLSRTFRAQPSLPVVAAISEIMEADPDHPGQAAGAAEDVA
ncbi:hypothetical protein [Paracoccus chinensis]|uniref:Glycosyl transferase family 2 n=1 Tax=Paracoccus chinensis TaxID=525640 RepID=A0A1G9GE18_9RHOB|nr:hypothetical protein [Paracoccus chinensis]SDK98938.1 hypothetical protein SAMN04487971_10545 [Paracoccus chinensis]